VEGRHFRLDFVQRTFDFRGEVAGIPDPVCVDSPETGNIGNAVTIQLEGPGEQTSRNKAMVIRR
jgi:hypothetical protein